MEHKIKRIVQRLLFSKIEPGLTMRGLAGEEPLVYKELILETIKPSELTLVDLTWSKERKAAGVKLENIQQEIVPIMDCDFCDTFKSSGVTLRTIKEAMDERCNNRYLLYTLCLRGAPLVTTWDWLNRNIYDNTLTEFSKDKIFTSGYYGKNYLMELKHEQSSFIESVIYHYKDTHPMVTGLVHW